MGMFHWTWRPSPMLILTWYGMTPWKRSACYIDIIYMHARSTCVYYNIIYVVTRTRSQDLDGIAYDVLCIHDMENNKLPAISSFPPAACNAAMHWSLEKPNSIKREIWSSSKPRDSILGEGGGGGASCSSLEGARCWVNNVFGTSCSARNGNSRSILGNLRPFDFKSILHSCRFRLSRPKRNSMLSWSRTVIDMGMWWPPAFRGAKCTLPNIWAFPTPTAVPWNLVSISLKIPHLSAQLLLLHGVMMNNFKHPHRICMVVAHGNSRTRTWSSFVHRYQ